MDTKALFRISYGLYVVSAKKKDGEQNGFVGNTVFQITSKPPRLAIGVSRDNYTWEFIQDSKAVAISVLNQDVPPDTIKTFGYNSGRDIDKFADTPWRPADNGAPVLTEGINATLECSISQSVELETHTIFIGEVTNAEIVSDSAPLTYDYYHKVMKGKAPKNAPTFVEESTGKDDAVSAEGIMVCEVCGYEYDPAKGDPAKGIPPGTPFEDLPDDWECPVCGSPKTVFHPKT